MFPPHHDNTDKRKTPRNINQNTCALAAYFSFLHMCFYVVKWLNKALEYFKQLYFFYRFLPLNFNSLTAAVDKQSRNFVFQSAKILLNYCVVKYDSNYLVIMLNIGKKPMLLIILRININPNLPLSV